MNCALIAAVGLEILTGAALFANPSLIARLLLSADLTPSGDTVGRIAGIAIFSLAIACLPRDAQQGGAPLTLKGLLLLSALVTAYLVYLGVSGASVGVLLWPAAATHFLLGVLLAGALVKGSAVTN